MFITFLTKVTVKGSGLRHSKKENEVKPSSGSFVWKNIIKCRILIQ